VIKNMGPNEKRSIKAPKESGPKMAAADDAK